MLNVALTGNIAAGKSTVVELFRRWGATVVDADALVREAQAPGTAVLAGIVQRFGDDVLFPDGSLDRAALRGKVMGDDGALAALNALVHPAVRPRRDELHRQAQGRGDLILVNDIPLLFETLEPERFDRVVLVDAPAAVRRARLRLHRGLTDEEADRMIASQMPAERKRPRSHFVIVNDDTLLELEARARSVFLDLRRLAARRAWGDRPSPVAIVAESAGDERHALGALGGALDDAGVAWYMATGGVSALARALAERPPALVVSSRTAQPAAVAALRRAGFNPPISFLVPAPEGPDAPGARVVLDLRPWGYRRVVLADNPLV
jgi:dephospho-CoA kinase